MRCFDSSYLVVISVWSFLSRYKSDQFLVVISYLRKYQSWDACILIRLIFQKMVAEVGGKGARVKSKFEQTRPQKQVIIYLLLVHTGSSVYWHVFNSVRFSIRHSSVILRKYFLELSITDPNLRRVNKYHVITSSHWQFTEISLRRVTLFNIYPITKYTI